MIVGIGTDIAEVERIGKLVEKYDETFLSKILRTDEIRSCNESAHRIQRIAARFAAKEALSKAFGTGISGAINFQNMGITSGPKGEPLFTLYDEAAELQRERGITHIHVSMSHTEHYATAVVILESDSLERSTPEPLHP